MKPRKCSAELHERFCTEEKAKRDYAKQTIALKLEKTEEKIVCRIYLSHDAGASVCICTQLTVCYNSLSGFFNVQMKLREYLILF